MTLARCLLRLLPLSLLCCAAAKEGAAATYTTSGTFLADNSSFVYSFNVASSQSYTFSTTSFATGGFVPDLTLFTAGGTVLGSDGADGPCVTAATCRDDASLSATLGAGSYLLYLTEFPNEANGNLSAGFTFGSDPNATGTVCGVSGGMFLQSDVAACGQRTNAYTLNVTNAAPTPEPGTLFLVLPAGLIILGFSRRSIA